MDKKHKGIPYDQNDKFVIMDSTPAVQAYMAVHDISFSTVTGTDGGEGVLFNEDHVLKMIEDRNIVGGQAMLLHGRKRVGDNRECSLIDFDKNQVIPMGTLKPCGDIPDGSIGYRCNKLNQNYYVDTGADNEAE